MHLKDAAKVAEGCGKVLNAEEAAASPRIPLRQGTTMSKYFFGGGPFFFFFDPKKKKSGALKIKWVRSFIGCPRDMRQTSSRIGLPAHAASAGSCKIHRPSRGMTARVHHLVVIEGLRMAPETDTFEFEAAAWLASPQGARGTRHGLLEDGQDRPGAGNKG